MDRIVDHRACIVTLDHHSNVLCQEVPGNIRSVPSALHGSLSLGPTLPLPRRRDSACHLNCLSRNEDVVPFIHWEVEDGSRAASSPGHRLQFGFVSVACADIFFVVCLKIRRQLSDVQCRWWNRPAAVFCRTCRLQLLQLLCSSSGLCQRRLEHPVPAPAVMSSITGKFENCKQPDKGFWEFTPSKVQTLWTLRVIQANWNLVKACFHCCQGLCNIQKARSDFGVRHCADPLDLLGPRVIFAGPLFDWLFGLNCISSEAASNQAELYTFFSLTFHILLIFSWKSDFLKQRESAWALHIFFSIWTKPVCRLAIRPNALQGEHHCRVAMAHSKCNTWGSSLKVWEFCNADIERTSWCMVWEDNILFYFSGYGAQQPQSQTDGLYEVWLTLVSGIVAQLKTRQ